MRLQHRENGFERLTLPALFIFIQLRDKRYLFRQSQNSTLLSLSNNRVPRVQLIPTLPGLPIAYASEWSLSFSLDLIFFDLSL